MSGRKNTLVYPVALNQSLSSTFTTSPTIIRYLDNCSYQIVITTTDSIGTFAVQGSNNYQENLGSIPSNSDWVDLTLGGGTPFVNAANDDIIIDLNQLPFNAIRLSYTSGTAGTGTCNIYLVCKELGG
jgi:hypothetical protein